ncbi:MAG: (2Fe-2S)-binding protein [Burkholderiales bacterium]|nr:(2Fe-2S)-binding protein [Burkholderiales bacterium]
MTDRVEISLQVNGVRHSLSIRPWRTLLEVLREELALTGTKRSCGEGQCGACTVLVDGNAVNACMYLALEALGRDVRTIEGPAQGDAALDAIQRSFVDKGAVQCGFCTPGMVMATRALLQDNPLPDEDAIREALVGHLCRCTGYVQIVEAIQDAAAKLAGCAERAHE